MEGDLVTFQRILLNQFIIIDFPFFPFVTADEAKSSSAEDGRGPEN